MDETVATKQRTRAWVWVIAGAVVVIGAAIVIFVLMNQRPSFQTVADECGGVDAGVLVTKDTLIVNPLKATSDTLLCVTDKLLPNTDDQYQVAIATDAGNDMTLHLGGYTVVTLGTPAGTVVSFT